MKDERVSPKQKQLFKEYVAKVQRDGFERSDDAATPWQRKRKLEKERQERDEAIHDSGYSRWNSECSNDRLGAGLLPRL